MHLTPRWYITAIATAVLLQAPAVLSAQRATDEVRRVEQSIEVLRDLTAQPDDGIPQYLLQRAEAIVVIPDMIRGGFVIGAKHGKGLVSVRDRGRNMWSPPAFVTMTGGSVGWQIGAQSIDLILLVMNRNGVNQLLDDRFTLGGELSVVAGPVGRTANAATDVTLESQILAYSRAKGLFAGATLEGVSLRADDDANDAFYGRELDMRDIALAGAPNSRAPIIVTQWSEAIRVASVGSGRELTQRPSVRPMPRDPDTADPVSIVSLTDRPDRYTGRRVAITAPIEDVYSRTLFSVDDDPVRSTGREVVVINPQPMDRLDDRGTVTIVGTLYEFNRGDLERRLRDWEWDVSNDVLRSFDRRPVVIAESIRVADRDFVAGRPRPPVDGPPLTYSGKVARIEDIVARPKDYYAMQVMLSAEIEDVYSRTVFAIDDDKLLSTGRDVLVVAPTIRRPLNDDMDVTIVGEVMRFKKGDVEKRFRNYKLDLDENLVDRFDGRPVILATSIRTRDGEELVGSVMADSRR